MCNYLERNEFDLTAAAWTALVIIAVAVEVKAQPVLSGPPALPGGGTSQTQAEYGLPMPGQHSGTQIDLTIRHVGTLRLELFDQEKPLTTRNFINYILDGSYSNSFIHRLIPNFLAQGGTFRLLDFGGSQAVAPVPESEPVENELGEVRILSNVKGTLALAHYQGLTNSGTCHWFINLADNTWLEAPDTNHSYTVFGRVIAGLDRLEQMDPALPSSTIAIVDMGDFLPELPVQRSADPEALSYDDLLDMSFTIVSLDMGFRISSDAGFGPALHWRTTSGYGYVLESAPTPTGPWSEYGTAVGDGQPAEIAGLSSQGQYFYRLRFE